MMGTVVSVLVIVMIIYLQPASHCPPQVYIKSCSHYYVQCKIAHNGDKIAHPAVHAAPLTLPLTDLLLSPLPHHHRQCC